MHMYLIKSIYWNVFSQNRNTSEEMKIVMAGFGYGANLSAVVCWASKTFWRRPWESRPRLFFSERSNVILSNWLLFSRLRFIYQEWDLIPTGSTVVLPCASVRTAPFRSRSLNASAVCHDCRGLWYKLVDVAVQARGSSAEAFVILSQTRAILAHHSN